jgi:hypothetical protein
VEKVLNARQEIMLFGCHLVNCRIVEHRKKMLFPFSKNSSGTFGVAGEVRSRA